MTRIYFLIMFLICSAPLCAQKFYLFIGTYTGGGSQGIYVYEFDAANGRARWISNTDSVTNPSYLAVSSNGNFVYAVNENSGPQGGGVSSFSFNRSSGKLRFLNSQPSGGDHPCYITVTRNNKWVFVGNYTGGNISALPVNNNGRLRSLSQLVQHKGSSINKDRQEKPHVHAAVLSPKEDHLFVPDLGTDRVMIYPLQLTRQKPVDETRSVSAVSTSGSGPRHFRFHPNGRFAYLMEELSGTVAVFAYSGKGKLKFLQRISSHPSDYEGTIGSADLHLSPDGKFLYASNRGDANNLAIFSVHPSTGKLTSRGYQPALGQKPRNFMIDPTGKFLLVANQDSDEVVIFRRNPATGLLRDTGERIKVSKPVCLQMSRK